ncbi:MAG: methyltransferase domain-containing protein [Deltaproteobacteria bacterium]|nr:methyltransferase domain-containing protein [Deltaproteobacteria bacterium]
MLYSDPFPSQDSYYTDNYSDYEKQNPAHKIQFYMDLVERWVVKGERIFELGVGLGVFLERATEKFDCQGCDINHYGVETCHNKLPQVPLFEGSYECIPANPPPKAVVCWDILEHLPDLNTALISIFSKLPKGGCLIGVVPVYDGPLGWLVHLLDKDPTHVTKISRKEWLGRLRQHGFDVLEYGGIIRKLIGSHYFHFVRPQIILKSCGTALYFAACKPGSSLKERFL